MQPPRHSYNRAARIRENKKRTYADIERNEMSGDDDELEPTKKRQKAKMSKEERKNMEKWVRSVNESFQEIDEFDLLVE